MGDNDTPNGGGEASDDPSENAEPSAEMATTLESQADVAPAPQAKTPPESPGRDATNPPPPPVAVEALPPAAPALVAGEGSDMTDHASVVFSQQLCEVHLMLDFLSGNPSNKIPDKATAQAAGLPDDWLEQVCRISWPPQGPAGSQAEQEALLIKVKDYLNTMAAPASGASVAFTLLVSQEGNAPPDGDDGVDSELGMAFPRGNQAGQKFSRNTLARLAYPGFIDKSRSFASGMFWIAILLTFWLIATCGLSWYAALGNAELGQLTAAQASLDTAQHNIAEAEGSALAGSNGDGTGTGQLGGGAPVTPSPSGAKPIAPKPATQGAAASGQSHAGGFCDWPKANADASATDVPTPARWRLCIERADSRQHLESAKSNIRDWLFIHRLFHLGSEKDTDASIYYATASVGVLGTGILPVMYGILGAAASVLRLLSRRMRLSLLTPRDWTLALQQLALGAVVGACIGLFATPPGTGSSAPGGDASAALFGSVKLSTSALSFIAGFGVDAVFAFLESLIARLFNINQPAPPAK